MSGPEDAGPDGTRGDVGSLGEEAAKLFEALSEQLGAAAGSVNDHVATGGAGCRYCPVCQLIGVVRATSPEVRAHLLSAAGSLVQAASGLLATHVPTQSDQAERDRSGRGPVEHIDLDDETGSGESR